MYKNSIMQHSLKFFKIIYYFKYFFKQKNIINFSTKIHVIEPDISLWFYIFGTEFVKFVPIFIYNVKV